MLNPGSAPIDNASEVHAVANIAAFAAEVRDQGLEVGEPQRDETADDGGRFGYRLPGPGGVTVSVLMPGVPLERVRDDRSTSAPCLKVGAEWWWWPSAVTVAAALMR